MAPVLGLQCSTIWAMKTPALEAGQFVEFILTHDWNETQNEDDMVKILLLGYITGKIYPSTPTTGWINSESSAKLSTNCWCWRIAFPIGSLIFHAVTELRNPAKFTKTSKILRNSIEILSNTCLYSNFETCLSYGGIYLPQTSKFMSKLRHWNMQTTFWNYQAWIMLRKTGH